MAERARKRNPSVILGIALLFFFGVVVWYGVTQKGWRLKESHEQPATIPAQPPVDPASEGKRVTVSGKLTTPSAVRDPDMGLSVDAIVLLRNVEMYQWREQCAGSDCKYDTEWSSTPIDSSKFHTPAGHENPRFPFGSARFATGPVRLAGYIIDPDVIAAQVQAEKYPVHKDSLPPNLAATFREADGELVTGEDMNHPKVGALRVSYRIVPARTTSLTGVQHGQRLSVN